MPETDKVVNAGWNQIEQVEDVTDGAVEAGMLLAETANGVAPHATAAGVVHQVLIAKDMRGRGFELGGAYPSGDLITVLKANGGADLTLLLDAGENVTDDTKLVSNGNGYLRAFDSAAGDTETAVVALASEAVDNSAGTEAVGIDVEVAR